MAEPIVLTGIGLGLVALGTAMGRGNGRLEAYRLTFPRDVRAEQVVAFARSLSGLLPPWWRRLVGGPVVVFEVTSNEHGIAQS